MLYINSDHLQVCLLHPDDDRDRMGVRYCTGGYIFQVSDPRHGDLMAGPTFPDSFNWFDGQGIPDAFNLSPLRNAEGPGPEALIPGIGLCDTQAGRVLEFCSWEVQARDASARFRTSQQWGGWSLEIERTVSVAGRVIRSETIVRNPSRTLLPIRWFPHPFYPLPEGPDLCRLSEPASLPAGTTYSVGPTGFLRCSDLAAAQAVPASCLGRAPLVVLQRHPALGLVAASYDFHTTHVLVWGNTKTFSFEPFLDRTVGMGSMLEFSAEYHF